MKKTPLELGRRERQIIETVQRLGEASVANVRSHLADPPSYSAVRTMLGLLVEKGWLKYRAEGKRYLYRAAELREKTQKTALRRLLGTLFNGSGGDAVAALLDLSAAEMSVAELDRLTEMIEKAPGKITTPTDQAVLIHVPSHLHSLSAASFLKRG